MSFFQRFSISIENKLWCKLCVHILNCIAALTQSLKRAPECVFRFEVTFVRWRYQLGSAPHIQLERSHLHLMKSLQFVKKNGSKNPLKWDFARRHKQGSAAISIGFSGICCSFDNPGFSWNVSGQCFLPLLIFRWAVCLDNARLMSGPERGKLGGEGATKLGSKVKLNQSRVSNFREQKYACCQNNQRRERRSDFTAACRRLCTLCVCDRKSRYEKATQAIPSSCQHTAHRLPGRRENAGWH